MKNRFLIPLLLLLALLLSGCGAAGRDDPRNADGIGPTELLVVSRGSGDEGQRARCIAPTEAALALAFPEVSVRRAFLDAEDGVSDTLPEALERAARNGVKNLIVLPTLLLCDGRYGQLYDALAAGAVPFETVLLGTALLTTEEDVAALAEALAADAPEDGKTAFCFVGAGTDDETAYMYGMLQQVFREAGHENCFVGTLSDGPEDVLEQLRAGGYTRAALRPLMLCVDPDAQSALRDWKRAFADAGLRAELSLRGLGELEAVQTLLVRHGREILAMAEEYGA